MAEFATRGVGAAGLTTGIIGSALGALNSGVLGNGSILGGMGNGYSRELAEKDALIAEMRAEKYSDKVGLELYRYIDGKMLEVEKRLGEQAVLNQANKDSFAMLCDRISSEASARKCADNAIVNYVNATFYPKLVADVTAGTTTTAQTVYNPLPIEGCGC